MSFFLCFFVCFCLFCSLFLFFNFLLLFCCFFICFFNDFYFYLFFLFFLFLFWFFSFQRLIIQPEPLKIVQTQAHTTNTRVSPQEGTKMEVMTAQPSEWRVIWNEGCKFRRRFNVSNGLPGASEAHAFTCRLKYLFILWQLELVCTSELNTRTSSLLENNRT